MLKQEDIEVGDLLTCDRDLYCDRLSNGRHLIMDPIIMISIHHHDGIIEIKSSSTLLVVGGKGTKTLLLCDGRVLIADNISLLYLRKVKL